MTKTKPQALLIIALSALTLIALPIHAQDLDLISSLVTDLGVTEAQAIGGTKALVEAAKTGLSTDEFSQLEALPALAGVLGGSATGTATGSDVGSLADSALGAVTGGDSSADSLGGLASAAGVDMAGLDLSQLSEIAGLASSFSELGLSADMAQKFLPVVLENLGGGSAGASLLTKGLGLL